VANTIKISKAKNLIFKKLSFLYLVFILFLFLSSPGKFLDHYENLEPGQEAVIEELNHQMISLPNTLDGAQALKDETQSTLNRLEEIRSSYHQYRTANHISGEKLKENLFATNEILQTSRGSEFQSALNQFNAAYMKMGGADLSDELLNLYDFSGQEFEARDFFFKETPNAVIESIINHLQTVILLRSIELLQGEKAQILNESSRPAEQLEMIQNFKKTLVRGESMLFKLRIPDSIEQFQVLINGDNISPNQVDSAYQHYSYLPEEPGNYNIDLLFDDQHYYHNFRVVKPGIHIQRNGSNYLSQVGEVQRLKLKPMYLPDGDVEFKSEHADIKFEAGELGITPFHPGAFAVYMVWQDQIIDSLDLYAKDVSIVDVSLMDLAGKENEISQVAYLEASNPFWQVVNFQLHISLPDGREQILHNATRFLRSELREAIRQAPNGSIMAFEDIKVIGKNGYTYRNGRSILKLK